MAVETTLVDHLSAQDCLTLLAHVVARLARLHSPAPIVPTPGQMLTAEDVAARLGRKVAYVRELLRAGELPGVRLPGRKYWTVSESALLAWQAKVVPTAPEQPRAAPPAWSAPPPLDTPGPAARYSTPEPPGSAHPAPSPPVPVEIRRARSRGSRFLVPAETAARP